MSVKERINVIFNSKMRRFPLTETSSNFTYSFNKNITRITEIIIKSVQIPFTCYPINVTNNVLTFNGGLITITITPGSYTSSSLGIELKSKIDAAFGDATTVVTFSNKTFKLSIVRGTPFIIDAFINIPASTASSILGFNVSSSNLSTVIGDSAVNLSGTNYVNIISNFLTKPIQQKTLYANDNYENVLTTILVDSSPGDIITTTNHEDLSIKLSYKFKIMKTDIIDIKLTDDDGNILDLNGSNFSMQVVFVTE